MIIKTHPNHFALFTYLLGCLAALMVTATTTAQSSSIEFPYQALVSKDKALVRSGPGKVHYGTQKLSAGQVLEVYRHDPDGWCAIRPVEGSFCIIPESTVEIVGEGVGEIKLAGTTPFVGTKLGSVEKPLWQVKLREKEKVALIGQLSWPSPEGHSTIWYQIKPPAGEFRWIHVSNLESLSGETMASIIAPEPPKPIAAIPKPPAVLRSNASRPTALPAVGNGAAFVPVKPTIDLATAQQPPAQLRRLGAENFAADQPSVQLASFEPSALRPPAPSRLPEPAAPAAETPPPLQDSGSGWRRATRAIPSDSPYKSASTGYDSPTTLRDEQLNQSGSYAGTFTGQPSTANALQMLNNRLTVEMLKAPSQWQLAPLEAATRQYMATANLGEQQAAQQFLAKLANCRQVAAGYSGANVSSFVNTNTNGFSNGPSKSGANFGTGNSGTSDGSTANENNLNNSAQFDATGWLNELKQARGTEPSTYVLQDETGKIIYHVTPMPGINLNRYLKKRVGVNGQLGFNQRLNLKHVTIERVFPL